ncbi:MAG: hypothetical protein ABMB14_39425, partial [Myxococcota bacterium]
MADPYLHVAQRQLANRIRTEGVAVVVRDILVPLAAAVMLVPLVRPTFLAFLDEPGADRADGIRAVVLRAAVVVVGWMSIEVYSALIRGPHRDVLALLPVDPRAVVRAELLTVAASRWWITPGAAIALSPIALAGDALAWVVAVAVIGSCTALGITGGALAHLLAIEVAESPSMAGVLDLIRGSNPRPVAAFLYAPGALLVASAGLLGLASEAVPAAAAGDPRAIGLAFAPAVGAVVAWPLARGLADRTWFRGTAVVSEIDARYAAVDAPADASQVYLDWLARFVPAGWRVYLLDDLRHGWRTRRTLVTAGWLLGLLAAGVGWTEAADGPIRAASVGIAAGFVVAANGVLLAKDVPPFLRGGLPRTGPSPVAARAVALAAWAAPGIGLGAISVA